jgi:hypothetical protein
LNPGLLVESDVALTGPAGAMRIRGHGTHLTLDASGLCWAAALRAGLRLGGWSALRSVARALESHQLRVDVETGGRRIFSFGAGCRGGLLSRLLGGAAVARRARA